MSYNIEAFLTAKKYKTLIPCICDFCNVNFSTTKKNIRISLNRHQTKWYCSPRCFSDSSVVSQNLICDNCQTSIKKKPSQITARNFCSRSCAATYNNTHKTKGSRRSKLEHWLESQLNVIFPKLKILYSDKTTINSELDIYIPELKLAFEINGIFHYEPIYGTDKLFCIQNNDNRKFQACLEKNIELCIIDSSQEKYFKEASSKKYLDIITHLVALKLKASKTDYVEVM